MATSLPVNLLNALGVSAPSAGILDKGKHLQDGFQSLLEVGVDVDANQRSDKEKLSNKRDDGRDIVAAYVDAPKEVAPETSLVDTADDDIEVHVRGDVPSKEKPVEATSKDVSSTEDAYAHGSDNGSETKKTAAESASAGEDVSAPQQATIQDVDTRSIAAIEKLANAIVRLLTANENASQQPVLEKFTGNAEGIAKKLEGLSPDILRRLQALLEAMPQSLQGQDKIAGKEMSGMASLFGQLVATLSRPDSVAENESGVENILSKLQALSDMVAVQPAPVEGVELTADNDNSKAYSPYKPTAFGEQSLVATASENSGEGIAQQNLAKAEAIAGAVANVQAAAKSEASFSGSGFSDMGGGQRDNPALALGLHRATTQSTTSQVNGAAFSKLLQQTSQPVLEQVIFHVKSGVDGGSSKIHIQLHPAELGKLDIKLEVDADGKTGITVTADNKNTLDLLQRDSRSLERALADAGLKADSGSLNFNLRGDGQDKNHHEQSQAALNYKQAMPEEEPLALDLLTRSYVVNLAEGLDIKI